MATRPRVVGVVSNGTCTLGGGGFAEVWVSVQNTDDESAEVYMSVPVADFGRYRLGARVYLEMRLAPKKDGE